MEKFIFIFRRSLVVNNYSFISQLLHCIVIFALIISPCLAHTSTSEDRRSNGYESIVQQPDFLEACVPCFEYIRGGGVAVPMDIMQKEGKIIDQIMSGNSITIEPVQKYGSRNAKNNTNKAGKELFNVYVQVCLLGLSVGFFISILFLLRKNRNLLWRNNLLERIFANPPADKNVVWDSGKCTWIPKSV
jgi:hypothetical protein